MTKRYVALLRGINVGASGRIRMDAMKRLLEDAGLSRVVTYIQSGNALFDADLPEQAAKEAVERALKDGANIATTAVLRTAQELAALVANCPFSADELEQARRANAEGESFYVCLLPQPPSEQALAALAGTPPEGDAYAVSGRDIYLLLRHSIRNSRLAIRLQKAFSDATVRGWNTMVKLNELSQQRNGG